MTTYYKNGHAVICKGKIGMIADMDKDKVLIQYGAGGPFNWEYWQNIQHATQEQVTAAGLDGTGFIVFEEL